MNDGGDSGHRQRLKERFLTRDQASLTDGKLLELLLTYAIPLKDVRPLAQELIAKFGGLSGVLAASPQELNSIDGIKSHSTTLIKLVDWIRTFCPQTASKKVSSKKPTTEQPPLFEEVSTFVEEEVSLSPKKELQQKKTPARKQGTGFFGKAVLKEAIQLLPNLPPHGTIDEIKNLIKQKLHFNAEETRRRRTDYIVYRMFSNNSGDSSLILFAQKYAGLQELREACFYRFCVVEPIMVRIAEELLLPSIGKGSVLRDSISEYIASLLPSSKSVKDYAHAIIDALAAGGIIKADRKQITFGYRDIPSASFAFVLHSEFPSSGMYDIAKLEDNPRIRTMLWNPDRILPALYDLRNIGIITKISEIDNIRQFTTKWTLSQVVDNLCNTERA